MCARHVRFKSRPRRTLGTTDNLDELTFCSAEAWFSDVVSIVGGKPEGVSQSDVQELSAG